MSDIGLQQTYWNGTLSSGTYNGYSEVINFDIVAPTYTFNRKKLRPTSFAFKKRKGYADILPLFYSINYKNRDVTDYRIMKEGACGEEKETHYMLLTNKQTGYAKVLTRDGDCINSTNRHDLCGGDGLTVNDCKDCICPCGFDRFFVTDFVKGTPRKLGGSFDFASNSGVQLNTNNGTVGRFHDEVIKYFDSVKIGDYIYVAESPSVDGSAVCGQVRRVVGKDLRTTLRDYDILLVDAPRQGLGVTSNDGVDQIVDRINTLRDELQVAIDSGNQTAITDAQNALDAQVNLLNLNQRLGSSVSEQIGVDAGYSIYPEWGDVVSYMTCEGLTTIHSLHRYRDVNGQVIENFIAQRTTACSGFDLSTCTYSVDEFNGRIVMLGDKGYTITGGLAQDKMLFSVDNQNYVGTDKTSQAVFRNFLVQFSKHSISVIVYDAAGNSFYYPISENMGLFSRNSFEVFQNSLYIVASDKRLYSCDISSGGTGAGYMLSLTDQSQQVKSNLELLNDGDEVGMSSDGGKLRIFINNGNKTKMLIYYRDYGRRVTHNVCTFRINRKSGELYLGSGAYLDTGTADIDGENMYDYTSYIEAYVGENEDGSNGRLNLFSQKSPQWIKMILGKGVYTDGNTKIVIDFNNNGVEQQYQHSKFEHIKRIDINNQLAEGGTPALEQCVLDSLSECSNVIRNCLGSYEAVGNTGEGRFCRTEELNYADNCICLDDKSVFMADTYSVFLDLTHLQPSELFKIRIISENLDNMTFLGMMFSFVVDDISVHSHDNEDLLNDGSSCCSEGKYIERIGGCLCE